MKRILPLILALVAGMAQADSNSDYRAGSDFARQIQGQGTGSIQGFKPQESIPSYNANPDETKYYGGVTAGGDGGLKNDGTTEWATGETGKTITESFMNKPKDILSPDAPFIQTGRDVVNRADSIVGNTGQQCSAQEINRSEFTNYTCERDTMVEEYCTRTASITGDWKYTDEYREVTIPHSQFRFSMNGLKLVFSVTAPVTGTVESASLSVYAAFFFLNSRYTFMNTTFNVGLANGQSDTYPLSGATGLQVTQGQVLTGSGCTANGNCLPHGNGDRKVYESLVSGASTFTLKLRMKVRDKEWVPRVEWVESCPFNKADGVLTGTECSEPGGTKTGVMEGKPWNITQACWAYRDKYVTQSADNGTCQKYVDNPACTLASRQCAFYSDEGTCLHEYATYSCESRTSGKVMVCGGDVFCLDGECDKAQSGKSSDFGEAVSQ
ncbi:TPA: conjugal transfer protein TraN, partial [Escherichia coli]|nr:conjugal transfer protein TraN [Escherichia coli]